MAKASDESEIEQARVGVDAYYSWMTGALEAMEQNLPAIIEAADKAAEQYVQEGWEIFASGDFGVVAEAVGRAGGIMRFRWGSPIRDYVKGEGKRVVLVALRDDHYDQYLQQARDRLEGDHSFVVLMGSKALLERAAADDFPMDAAFENQAAEGEGLFSAPDGRHLVATSPVASMAALWVWTAEFVAACTRRGEMPLMHMSYAIPGARERAESLKGMRMEESAPPPVAAGVLGQAFLRETRANLERFYQAERDHLAQASVLAHQTSESGEKVYAFLHGHAIVMDQLTHPGTPGYFTQLNSDWFKQRRNIELQENDFVLCIGYAERFHDGEYEKWDEGAREAGAQLVWSFADYNPEQVEAVRDAGELWINQHWEYGDAVVEIPGFDFKLFPTSGVIAQAVLRMVEAGIYALNNPESL